MRLAIDPGQTCGIAWRADDGTIRAIQWPGDSIVVVLDGFRQRNLTEVVVENFRSRPGPAINLSASETIGRIMAWCDAAGVPYVRQEVSAVKTRVNNDRLRQAGGWARGQDHARDAARHLLYREEQADGIRHW